jgi:hypothetical protein
LHDAKPSRFDRLFARKRKKIRVFDQFLQVGFNQELKFLEIGRAAPRRGLPKNSKRARIVALDALDDDFPRPPMRVRSTP